MRFTLQMAWRDSKASRRRLLAFSLCIVFGIGALVALDSFGVSLGRAIDDQSKALLGADVVMTSRLPFPAAVRTYLAGLGAEVAEETEFSTMMVFPSAGGATHLVQVRAESGRFPFYGELVTDPPEAASRLRSAQATGARLILLEASLFGQFHLHPGDPVRLGQATFRIAGAIEKIAGESLAVTLLAPRAVIPARTLASTGIDESGPLVRRRLAIKLPADVDAEALVRDLRNRFAADRFSYETVAGRRRELGRVLTDVNGFLSLVGFIALLLGAIGVASAVHVHVREKVPTVGVLRCLGATAGQAFAIYLVQGCALGLVGALLGAALGVGIQAALPALFQGLLPVPLTFAVSGWAIVRGMGAGLVIGMLFTLGPLLAIRRVPPLAALRAAVAERTRTDASVLGLGLITVAAVAAFAVWQTRSLPVGLGFTGALGLGLMVFGGVARGLAAATRRWTPRGLPYVVRQGIGNLHRPQNRTVLLLVALGLGAFLFLTLFLTRTSFLRELELAGSADRPNLMFFDIQDSQIGPLDKLLASRGAPARQQAPLVAMTIASLDGRPVNAWLRDRRTHVAGWALRREYRSTYRDHLSDTETVTQGRFVGRVAPNASPFPISVDEGLADDLHLKLGEPIDWSVEGVTVHTYVGSIRTVDWRRLEPNFFVVFPDGVLEDAPKYYVAAVRTSGAEASGQLEQAVVQAFPNVTAIELGAILSTLDGIFRRVAFVVEFMALFTAATAVVVLAAAVFASRHQRRRELVLLRILGASRGQLARVQATEYAILGALAALTGCLLAWPASSALAHYMFRLRPAAPFGDFAGAAVLVTAVTLLTGWLADRSLPSRPPLESLRSE